MDQKGQAQVLILAGIVILIAVAGGVFYWGRLTAPKPQPQTAAISSPQPSPLSTEASAKVEDPTANWKTYTNEEYRYLFKYPKQTSIDDQRKDYIWLDDQISIQVTSKDPESCQGACPAIRERKNIEIEGVEAKELDGTFGVIGGNVPHSFRSVSIPHNNQYYEIMVYEIKHDDKLLSLSPVREVGNIPESQLKFFDQILSTFKFLP